MKPANFPERINDRRKRALSRMKPTDSAYETTQKKIVSGSLKHLRSKRKRG